MFFDPVYWVVIGVGLLLSVAASARVKSTFAHYSRQGTQRGQSGAEVARGILRDQGVTGVQVVPVAGTLTDHYDPRSHTLRLSEPVYGSHSMAAVGIAAHEVGHALQHAAGYTPLRFRSAWVPVANLGSGLSMLVLFLAAMMGGVASVAGHTLAIAGVALFATTTVFTLITLPVEFDASRRALVALRDGGYATSEELDGARRVLSAAALTYVAAFVSSLLILLYWAMRLGLLGGRRSE